MANLPSSGALSLQSLKSFFGGSATPKLTDYYRGGAYVPNTTTSGSSTRTPSTGSNYYRGETFANTYWTVNGALVWNSATITTNVGNAVSYTVGNTTYYRDALQETVSESSGYTSITVYYHRVYQIVNTQVVTNVNTGIPTSGPISLSHFYGAFRP